MTRHLKGLLITATGIVLLSPDSLIIRLIDTSHANVLFWRGLLVFQGMLLLITWVHGRQSVQAFRAIGLPGVGAMFMWTLSSLFFVSALFHTSVANTLVLLSTSPVFAAFVSWLWLRETIGQHTVLAIVVLMRVMIFEASLRQKKSLTQLTTNDARCCDVLCAVICVSVKKRSGQLSHCKPSTCTFR